MENRPYFHLYEIIGININGRVKLVGINTDVVCFKSVNLLKHYKK